MDFVDQLYNQTFLFLPALSKNKYNPVRTLIRHLLLQRKVFLQISNFTKMFLKYTGVGSFTYYMPVGWLIYIAHMFFEFPGPLRIALGNDSIRFR